MQMDARARRNSAKSLARAGRIDELRGLADAGDGHAARHLADWLARNGRIDELRERMATGDRFARRAYSDHLVRRRRFPEAIDTLRPLADSGIPGAQLRLARLLAGYGRYQEAMAQLRQVPAHWDDTTRVAGWLNSRGLVDPAASVADLRRGYVNVRRDYVDALRRGTRAGDSNARQQLSWIVLMWWLPSPEEAVALLGDIGPSDWLHERLVDRSRGWRRDVFRATVIDLLATAGGGAYRRTRAALLLLQGRRDDAVAQLRSLAAEGDQRAERDLAAVLDAELPLREIRMADHPEPVNMTGLAFSPDGATLAVWGHGVGVWARVALWDAATGEPRGAQRLSTPYPGGVNVRRDGTVEEEPGPSPWEQPPRLTCPDGNVLVVDAGGRVQVCDGRTGMPIRDTGIPRALAMALSPDGAVLATGPGNTSVRLWELATGRLVRTIDTPVIAVAFRPDGAVLATADSLNDIIRLWNVES